MTGLGGLGSHPALGFSGETDAVGVNKKMRPALKTMLSTGILVVSGLAGLLLIARAEAGNEADPAKGTRGGLLAKTERHQFEVFFYPTGIRLFPQDSAGKSLDATNMSAISIYYHPNSQSPWFDRPLRPASTVAGESPTSLEDVIGLGTVPASGAKVVFEVSGLADPAERAVSFTLPVEFITTQAAGASAGVNSPTPRFVYASGFQGVGYYANPAGPQAAPSAATAARPVAPPRFSGNTGGQSVGPGVRDWSTGRRGRLHKPWMQSGG